MGCVFCEIVAGERRQEVVYADETVVAFLSEPQAAWGHVLVVPRAHREDVWAIPREEAEAAMAAAHLLARVLRDELGAEGVNLRQNSGAVAGQDVFHFHLHVIPRNEGDTIGRDGAWGAPPWTPPAGGEAERRRVADAIRRGLSANGWPRPAEAAAAAILDDRGRLLLIREGYGRRRYGFPGGAVERGESQLDAVVREVREETGLEARVEDVVGVYRLESSLVVTLFRCAIVGEPALPEGGEIAELGWFAPDEIPEPRTNALRLALADVLASARGVVRENDCA